MIKIANISKDGVLLSGVRGASSLPNFRTECNLCDHVMLTVEDLKWLAQNMASIRTQIKNEVQSEITRLQNSITEVP